VSLGLGVPVSGTLEAMYQLKENQQPSIRTLHEQGWSKRRIAWEPGLDRATVRKYLARVSNRRLEFELGAGFEGFSGFALVLALSQMREHGLGSFDRIRVRTEWRIDKAQ
jgi:hypothetical protein